MNEFAEERINNAVDAEAEQLVRIARDLGRADISADASEWFRDISDVQRALAEVARRLAEAVRDAAMLITREAEAGQQ